MSVESRAWNRRPDSARRGAFGMTRRRRPRPSPSIRRPRSVSPTPRPRSKSSISSRPPSPIRVSATPQSTRLRSRSFGLFGDQIHRRARHDDRRRHVDSGQFPWAEFPECQPLIHRPDRGYGHRNYPSSRSCSVQSPSFCAPALRCCATLARAFRRRMRFNCCKGSSLFRSASSASSTTPRRSPPFLPAPGGR